MPVFLREIGQLVTTATSLFLWLPIVWLMVKLVGWWQSREERERERHEKELRDTVKREPWKLRGDYWRKQGPVTSSDPVAPGDFYVEERECIQCGAPAAVPPGLIRHRAGDACGSCFFVKQPTSPAEVEQAVAAVNASCVCAVRYRGSDPTILARISPMSVDHPFRTLHRRDA